MSFVPGHSRETGWVRGHFRHPLSPGLDQAGLAFLVMSPVRIDLSRYRAASCRLADRPRVPRPRSPTTPGARDGGPGPPSRSRVTGSRG